jgi:hypothetical protein
MMILVGAQKSRMLIEMWTTNPVLTMFHDWRCFMGIRSLQAIKLEAIFIIFLAKNLGTFCMCPETLNEAGF